MQGTVWAGLMCTTTMDKLGQIKYENEELCYKYKGTVPIPVLQMVDDIVDVQVCGVRSVETNSVINAFIEGKKLRLSHGKHIHCGIKIPEFATLKVHEKNMQRFSEEKYLGDTICKTGKLSAIISKRRAKGYGIVLDILGILQDVPCGKRRI